jgi:leucyl-tRNA synthetase
MTDYPANTRKFALQLLANMEYNFNDIERKWQKFWKENQTYHTENGGEKPKYYVLDMFPYPSGAGLHVGHPLGYIASDIVARYKRLKGYNVLHPMGYDAFGLPAEQYAIQTGRHPADTTKENIARYREQLDKIGFSFDWSREVQTCDPKYYKWTQWIFVQLFKSWYNCKTQKAESVDTLTALFESEGFNGTTHRVLTGDIEHDVKPFTAAEWKNFSEKEKSDVLMNFRLAYLGEAWVNWCSALGTVLANDEVKDGVSERGGYPVERKRMPQWSMRITAYADRLLNDLNGLDWSDSIKEAQRNWIGKSEGSSIEFRIADSELRIEVFTTRPDTIFGVTFVTLAPEHELVDKITTAEYKDAVAAYVNVAKNKSERERQAEKKVSGQFTGAFVIHPFTNEKVPVYIGEYVLAGYGTGAVMAVPAHDSRDFAFAKHFNLGIPQVVTAPADHDFSKESYDAKEGKLINSDFLNGLDVKDAVRRAIDEIEKCGIGQGKVNYRLRDAAFGRQRYWGEPIPVYYKTVPSSTSASLSLTTELIPEVMDESDLPLILPEVDKFLPTESGEPPLARAKDWTYKGSPLETTTMPGWAGSSWYFLRYMDPQNDKELVSKEVADYWKNVDLYLGGAEHATGHLLYVRFWTKFLFDIGKISVNEPAQKLVNQGMIQGESQFIKQVLIEPRLKSKFENRTLKLRVWNDGVLVKEFELDSTIANQHVYVSQDSKLVFDFIDPVSSEIIPTFINEHRADVNFVKNNVLDIELWVRAQPQYKPILIGRHSYWHWKVKTWLGFMSTLPYPDQFTTRPEVEKMSKSKNNVVSPDDRPYEGEVVVPGIVEAYGADTLRLYEMFLGPLEQHKPWSTNGISGTHNFLKRFFRLFAEVSNDAPAEAELKVLHRTLKKVADDIERMSFNTCVSTFMIAVNELNDLKCNKRAVLEPLVIALSPFAPHAAEELWSVLGHKESVTKASFPVVDEKYLVDNTVNYPVQFNGKMRFTIALAADMKPADVEKEVLASAEAQKYLEGKAPKKVIVVPKKIVNVVM